MIIRSKATQTKSITPLSKVVDEINNNIALRLSVLETSVENGILVVLSSDPQMVKITKLALQDYWPGEIEVYSVSDLAIGSRQQNGTDDWFLESQSNRSQRLN